MRTPNEIRTELESLADERTRLWKQLSLGHERTVAVQVKQINRAMDNLWLELRRARNEVRFGQQAEIIARAKAEARIEDELRRRLSRARTGLAAPSR